MVTSGGGRTPTYFVFFVVGLSFWSWLQVQINSKVDVGGAGIGAIDDIRRLSLPVEDARKIAEKVEAKTEVEINRSPSPHDIGAAVLQESARVEHPTASIKDDFSRDVSPVSESRTKPQSSAAVVETVTSHAVAPKPASSAALHNTLRIIPLEELVQSRASIVCDKGLVAIRDKVVHDRPNLTAAYKIPHIMHMTSKTRCVHPEFAKFIDMWRFPGYDFYFHDDEAVDRLLDQDYSDIFPGLQEIRRCVTAGATKADLWRLVVLWTYGGMYSDIDNTPTPKLNEHTVGPDDDAFFLPEGGSGALAQYFMASSKHHPLLKYALQAGILSLKGTSNVMVNNPALTTGPGALKNGFILFMNESGVVHDGYPLQGIHVGAENRSVRVLGTTERPREYINRAVIAPKQKKELYLEMNMTHFKQVKVLPRNGRISCKVHLERTNGTNKVANYKYLPGRKKYIEVEA